MSDFDGVWGAARVQGEMRNTRDPSAHSLSGQGGSYKPKAKSSAVQRESEGRVVPLIAVTNNAAGRKEPCFGHVRHEGKHEGMAASADLTTPAQVAATFKCDNLKAAQRIPIDSWRTADPGHLHLVK